MLYHFLCVALLASSVHAVYDGAFQTGHWTFSSDIYENVNHKVKFIVALKLQNADKMHSHFLTVSDPTSSGYGKYLSAQEMYEEYGPSAKGRKAVLDYFKEIPEVELNIGEYGDLLEVVAPTKNVESVFKTKLGLVSNPSYTARAVRAKTDLSIPDEIADYIDFVSLNTPVTNIRSRSARKAEQKLAAKKQYSVGVVTGNEEALVRFTPTCGDGNKNYINPPCTNLAIDQIPLFTFSVNEYTNTATNDYILNTDATVFTVPFSKIYCYNSFSAQACAVPADQKNCTCLAKLSPLPKYTQLSVNVTETFPQSATPSIIYKAGQSSRFMLSDVATPNLLSELYNIPKGMSVNHGSNQSVAEFYGEFYSNKDLSKFLALSGLPNASIPSANVYGDLPNVQSKPGGEAQLDVEYIMALAPGAPTYFYSMADYNPTDPVDDPVNEGFLAYLQIVDGQAYPPLVHSMSYGDIEAQIFNYSKNGSVAYAMRCDQEFMQMGLRGLTILFASGDDGVGSALIGDDPELACSKTFAEWPTSSPYVTSVGATVLSDKYLPVCGQTYAPSTSFSTLPLNDQLTVECHGTAEVVCSSVSGGVITSGGGFSTVYSRAAYAPWQQAAVNNYLRTADASAYPPLSYFDSLGRGYPDISTYGSNYFVYLNGKITRESGTSASTPVFSAMVTLWNDIRLANKQAPMGFIAPFLYHIAAQNPEAFNDVVVGNNACSAGSSIDAVDCCPYSFGAVPGWDAVTGLGTPNFQVIANLVINNATAFPNLGAYPNGVSQQVFVVSDDDSTVKDQSNIAYILSIAGVAAGGLSFILIVGYILSGAFHKKEGEAKPLLL